MVHVPVKRLGEQQGGGHLKTIENYSEDEKYMVLAMELAKKGYGYTAPNPVVGAVIVKNGCIIGQGYHEKYGEPHAERNALASCTQSPEGATIYVTLEPCCHHGKLSTLLFNHEIVQVLLQREFIAEAHTIVEQTYWLYEMVYAQGQ